MNDQSGETKTWNETSTAVIAFTILVQSGETIILYYHDMIVLYASLLTLFVQGTACSFWLRQLIKIKGSVY